MTGVIIDWQPAGSSRIDMAAFSSKNTATAPNAPAALFPSSKALPTSASSPPKVSHRATPYDRVKIASTQYSTSQMTAAPSGAGAAQQPHQRRKSARDQPGLRPPSLCATHPSLYRTAPVAGMRPIVPTAPKVPNKMPPTPLPTPPESRASSYPAEPCPSSDKSDSNQNVDPTWTTFSRGGLPPEWNGNAMLSTTDYNVTHGSVFSPTYVHGLPFGGTVEVAQLYRP